MKRTIGVLLAAALGAAGLAACSSVQTQTSQCGWIVTSGFQQSHGVKRVVYPNESVSKDSSDQAYYVPCNARNYLITNQKDSGDRHNPAVVMTGGGGGQPGTQVNIWLTVHWTLNEDQNTLIDFWAFCQKYTCQSSDQNDNSANNSTPGWNSMLAENMSPAIDRAAVRAALDFAPNLWSDQSQWPKLASAISADLPAELRSSTGVARDFFCADGPDTRNGAKCQPPTVTVENVDPTNGNLRNIQNQQSEMDAQQAQNAQRVTQARQLYGDYWSYFLGLQDTIDKCHAAGQSCTIVLGNGTPSVTAK